VRVSTHEIPERQVVIEVAWCPACQADRTVEVVTLDGDPGPVAVCVDCGLGVETWWMPWLIATSGPYVRSVPGGVARAS
jgi:Zn ribbon nucleic-acid-binding protein